jgi:hypothetical protein
MINNLWKLGLILLSIILIANCAGNRQIYTFKGAQYNTQEEAIAAQRTHENNLVAQIQPFEHPLVDKKLIVSIPTKEAIYADYIFRLSKKAKISSLTAEQSDTINFNAMARYEMCLSTYKAIKQKNIYKTVELVESSYTSIIQPSATCDTLCDFSSGEGSVVTYMLNVKNGKQVFTFDSSFPDGLARTESLLNAVKAFALQ